MLKMYKSVKVVTLSLAFLLFNSNLVTAAEIAPNSNHYDIAKVASILISKNHYRNHELDDEISRKLFDLYFKQLDPQKMYFTNKDIAEFKRYRDKLDEDIYEGNLDFAYLVYNKLVKRVTEFEKFAKKQLKKGFDFTINETYYTNRKDANWAPNMVALKDLWRQKLKNDVLYWRLVDRARKEKNNKNDKKEKLSEALKKFYSKTPEERVQQRLKTTLRFSTDKEAFDVLEEFLTSLTHVYDPHSNYMAPSTLKQFNIQLSLSLVGIGAVLQQEMDGSTKIVRIIKGGPAAKQGSLKVGDRIIAVSQNKNDTPKDVVNMPLNKVVDLIRGKKDTMVYLTVIPVSSKDGTSHKIISIKRNKVDIKDSAASGKIETMKDSNGKDIKVGVITLPSFYRDSSALVQHSSNFRSLTRDVKKIIENMKNKKVAGLVLDLRANGGGNLDEAVQLTGLFIDKGPVVQVKQGNGAIKVLNDKDNKTCYSGPIVLLLSRISASASEIFAGAIQDYKRGILVGDSHTHGKGTVQVVYDLDRFFGRFVNIESDPRGALKFTSAKFYRISGNSTQLKGVEPDIQIPSFTDAIIKGEKELEYALEWDSIGGKPHKIYDPGISTKIKKLKKLSKDRIQKDKDFKILAKDIEKIKKVKDRNQISLNEEARWKEYKIEKAIEEEQKKLLAVEEDKQGSKDLQLNEAKNILKDYLTILKK